MSDRSTLFLRQFVARQDNLPAATLERAGAIVLVGKKMTKRGEQERAKFSLVRIQSGEADCPANITTLQCVLWNCV